MRAAMPLKLKKIRLMHCLFGKVDEICKNCSNLRYLSCGNHNVTKCKYYGETNSEASDWVQKWQACGMFNMPWDGRRMMGIYVREEAKEAQFDGQIKFEMEDE